MQHVNIATNEKAQTEDRIIMPEMENFDAASTVLGLLRPVRPGRHRVIKKRAKTAIRAPSGQVPNSQEECQVVSGVSNSHVGTDSGKEGTESLRVFLEG